MVDKIIEECKPKMKVAIDSLYDDLSRIRSGRANAAILDGIMVSVYGTSSSIREIASITVPESNMIAIKPWDRNALAAVETAIKSSDLGINPINDGTQIRLVLPPMTEDRRKEMVGQVKKYGEGAKVVMRNIRGEAWSRVQHGVKNNEATEDDKYMAEEKLNKLIDEKNKEIDKIVSDKEVEMMKI